MGRIMANNDKDNDFKMISFVLPVLDEGPGLPELHQKIGHIMAELKIEYEMIFIDDGSQDDSFKTLVNLREKDERIKIIQFRRNFGKAAAYMAGFEAANGDVIATMDTDLQDDPNELPLFLDKLHEGYDLVIGWKYQGKGAPSKALPSKIFNKVVAIVSGLPLHDFNCPFKVYRRELVDELEIYGELHRYIPVIAHARGFTISEVKISNHPRKYGRSKYGLERFLRGMFDLITVIFISRFAKRPLHLLGLTGIIATLFGTGIISLFVIAHFLHVAGILPDASWNIHDRPAISLGILLLIVGVQFFSIGLIGELIVNSRHARASDGDYSIKNRIV